MASPRGEKATRASRRLGMGRAEVPSGRIRNRKNGRSRYAVRLAKCRCVWRLASGVWKSLLAICAGHTEKSSDVCHSIWLFVNNIVWGLCQGCGNKTAFWLRFGEDARAPTRSPQGGRARQNAAKNPADLHAEGNARGARRAERQRASSTRSPAVDAAGVTAGRGMASPRRRPRPAARAAGLWPKRGRPAPSDAKRSEGQRSGAAAPRA